VERETSINRSGENGKREEKKTRRGDISRHIPSLENKIIVSKLGPNVWERYEISLRVIWTSR